MKYPKHTCPDIDRILEIVNNVLKVCDKGFDSDDSLNDINNKLGSLWYEVTPAIELLEELRESNHSLRTLAIDFEDKCFDLENDIEDLQEEIRDLKQQLEEYK